MVEYGLFGFDSICFILYNFNYHPQLKFKKLLRNEKIFFYSFDHHFRHVDSVRLDAISLIYARWCCERLPPKFFPMKLFSADRTLFQIEHS
jgi:hypothetical protein